MVIKSNGKLVGQLDKAKYEKIGNLMMKYVQERLVKNYGMKIIKIPLKSKFTSQPVDIYVSLDF